MPFAKLSPDLIHAVVAVEDRRFYEHHGIDMESIARALPHHPEPPLTRYSAMVLGYSQTFDLTAARTQLRWAPRYSPEDALAWAIREREHG